jgi:putative toxin-antitoxin system antitoxin component (TIGR02293 family)
MPFCQKNRADGQAVSWTNCEIPMPARRSQGFHHSTIRLKPVSSDDLPLSPTFRAPADALAALAEQGYSEEEIFTLVVPKRTLARRHAAHDLLTIEETDKLLRLKRIAILAQRVFGDADKAHRWLRKPKRELKGETPLAFLASETSARVVEEMLHRIEHGIYA